MGFTCHMPVRTRDATEAVTLFYTYLPFCLTACTGSASANIHRNVAEWSHPAGGENAATIPQLQL
eukprot:4463673-Amphidinium_carterae.2